MSDVLVVVCWLVLFVLFCEVWLFSVCMFGGDGGGKEVPFLLDAIISNCHGGWSCSEDILVPCQFTQEVAAKLLAACAGLRRLSVHLTDAKPTPAVLGLLAPADDPSRRRRPPPASGSPRVNRHRLFPPSAPCR